MFELSSHGLWGIIVQVVFDPRGGINGLSIVAECETETAGDHQYATLETGNIDSHVSFYLLELPSA